MKLSAVLFLLVGLCLVYVATHQPATSSGAPDSESSRTRALAQELRGAPHGAWDSSLARSVAGTPASETRFESVGGAPLSAVAAHAVIPPLAQLTVTGLASWFCGSRCTRGFARGGPYAAAGSELRIPGWRGSWVRVCSGTCTTVQLIDWCACKGARIIDLYRAPFSALADPSRGIIPVSVTFVQVLPATDTR